MQVCAKDETILGLCFLDQDTGGVCIPEPLAAGYLQEGALLGSGSGQEVGK